MTLTILSQPTADSLNAAYRPIVFTVRASDATPPPVVYCDIYFGGVYRKTLAKTMYVASGSGTTDWLFDIQDSCQEVLKKAIATNGGSVITSSLLPFLQVYCKFRYSTKNIDGFTEQQTPIPVQGTGLTAPAAGGGIQSNTLYVVNATLQHEHNQSLPVHLNAYKNGTWNAKAFPLSHRPLNAYKICVGQNDYFPLVYLEDAALGCVRLHYKYKGDSAFNTANSCGSSSCVGVAISGTVNFPDAQVDYAYLYSFNLTGTGPFTLSNIAKPGWLSISLSGNTVSVFGTPPSSGSVSIFFRINNCGGANHVDVTDTFNVAAGPACVPVTIESTALPDAMAGTAYDFQLDVSGTAPFNLTVNSKPSWMTVQLLNVGGAYVLDFSGTPTNSDVATGVSVDVTVTNCSGAGSADRSETIDVAANNQVYFDPSSGTNEGDASYVEETKDIVGPEGANVQITVDNYINNNSGGSLQANGSYMFMGNTLNVTIPSGGRVTLTFRIDGNPDDGGTVVLGHFTITSTTIGVIGTPNSFQTSKVF